MCVASWNGLDWIGSRLRFHGYIWMGGRSLICISIYLCLSVSLSLSWVYQLD